MVATFSTSSLDDFEWRKMLRERRREGVPKELVEGLVSFKFVLGKSGRGLGGEVG